MLISVTKSVHGVNACYVFLLVPQTTTLWNQDSTDTNRHIRSEVTYDKWVWSATDAEVVAFTIIWPHMQQLAAAMQSSVYCH
jgi:ABC-type transport system involved in Fe-S cluster assembly fused permease/ATPase subunit